MFSAPVHAAVPGNVLNEVLGPRVNVGLAGVLGLASFVVCAIAPSFAVYLASYILLLGALSLLFRQIGISTYL